MYQIWRPERVDASFFAILFNVFSSSRGPLIKKGGTTQSIMCVGNKKRYNTRHFVE
ncbi:Uncharacterized protein APZ42_028725 [Daphnia magna]|uniref:Uncharacterized protein n=1 Tax=Daphnia magna TaxID=35525 RepID=A0A164QBI0_9CRUS|nr:Uncharacterized protein APZ42_028725 [Daphnia magna]